MGLEVVFDRKKVLCDALSYLADNNSPFKLSKELGKTLREAKLLVRFNTAIGVPGYDYNVDGLVFRRLVQAWPEMDTDVREMLLSATGTDNLVDLIIRGDVDSVKVVEALLPKVNNPSPKIRALVYDPAKFQEYVKKGDAEAVKALLPRVDPSADDNSVNRWIAEHGISEVVEAVRAMLPKVDPSADKNRAIRLAAENGHIDVVKLLLKVPRVDPSADDNDAIRLAAENGHIEVVELLLKHPRVDPSDNPIRLAAANGHLAVVKLLMTDKRVDPSVGDNWAIGLAAFNNHVEVVKLLMTDKRVDPSADDNWAIRMATFNNHAEVVKLLLADKRVDPKAALKCDNLSPTIRALLCDSAKFKE